MKKGIIEKLFWVPNYFTIAIRRRENELDSLINTGKFISDIELKGCKNYWVADPMLVENEGRTFLFYEACHSGKGIIEVIEILEDGMVTKPEIVLEKDYHQSYPFVFEESGNWYMIPESSECNEVQLYKASQFPNKWEKVDTLLVAHAVDTTLYKVDNQFILVTFVAQNGTEEVEPKAYRMKLENDQAILEELKWENWNGLRVRGAGGFFESKKKLYRPAQINYPNSYGEGLLFKEVFIEEDTYREKDIVEIDSSNIVFKRYRIDGLHTSTSTERHEAIDVRCSFFDLLKPIRKVKSYIKR
jgi:hypothetical protein